MPQREVQLLTNDIADLYESVKDKTKTPMEGIVLLSAVMIAIRQVALPDLSEQALGEMVKSLLTAQPNPSDEKRADLEKMN